MNYQKNKERAKTRPTKPTMTDQSAANETDINVIVRNFTVHGQAPGNSTQPTYADFTELPRDLRGFIEMGRTLSEQVNKLPKQLQALAPEDLFKLTNEQITTILTPPQTEAKLTPPQTEANPETKT